MNVTCKIKCKYNDGSGGCTTYPAIVLNEDTHSFEVDCSLYFPKDLGN